MKLRRIGAGAILAGLLSGAAAVHAEDFEVPVTLRGSTASMKRQNSLAHAAGLVFVQTRAQQRALEADGALVRMAGNADYSFRAGISSTLARPEMQMFIERLAAEYRAGCGERLIVTSATRPKANQPRNAHRLSVHPAGIAVDLRVSARFVCRRWLERTLLGMEEEKLLDVTREYYPPHYHVALFVEAYAAYEQRLGDGIEVARAADARSAPRHDIFAPAPPTARASIATAPARDRGPVWLLLTALPLAGAAAVLRRRRN